MAWSLSDEVKGVDRSSILLSVIFYETESNFKKYFSQFQGKGCFHGVLN